jgi:hypothetical protein
MFGAPHNTASGATLEVPGTDAIWLAGRTDVEIPPLGGDVTEFFLKRQATVLPEHQQETFPQSLRLCEGTVLSFQAGGTVDYFEGTAIRWYPDGNAALHPCCSDRRSVLNGVEGISGHYGPKGPLVGLFLDDENPLGAETPPPIDFWGDGTGPAWNFSTLSPGLGQVFFIGDGVTDDSVVQTFVAPSGTTRLFLGIPDGGAFWGDPGFYEDNDGSFFVTVRVVAGANVDCFCPCDAQLDDTPWKNHGQYVSCVTHEVKRLVAAGLIAPNEGGPIKSTAAQSDCGN